MRTAPAILINHLLEPPAKTTGITRYLFALLEELVSDKSFRYILATTWARNDLPEALRSTDIVSIRRRFIESTALNVLSQTAVMSRLMFETRAALEFNCNPIGCFLPLWPRVITVHDMYYQLRPEDFPRRRQLWFRFVFPRALSAASTIICVSRATQERLKQYYPRYAHKTVVIHEAGALRDYGRSRSGDWPQPTSETPYGVFVGNISPNKNPAVLVDALRILEERGRPVTIYHIGRDELGLLAEAQRRAGLQLPIKSAGTVSDETLNAIYYNAHFLVNTSIDEGFCLPVIEAQARGVPVVCSNIPVLQEVAGDGALFFEPDEPIALADAVSKIVMDPSFHARMSMRARANASSFSWSRAASETGNVFRQVLEATTTRVVGGRAYRNPGGM